MPNYCESDLWIRGPKVDRDRLRDLVTSEIEDKDYDFASSSYIPKGTFHTLAMDFQKITPRPAIYDTFGSPVSSKDAEKSKLAMELHGSPDWYEWCCANWGTKWNAGDVVLKETKTSLKYTFQTAWAPPVPVIAKLAGMFPSLTFVHKYYECGMQYQGCMEYRHGTLFSESEGKYKGNRGG